MVALAPTLHRRQDLTSQQISQGKLTLSTSWNSQGVTSEDGSGVRGRELIGEAGLLFTLLPSVLLMELVRLRPPRVD